MVSKKSTLIKFAQSKSTTTKKDTAKKKTTRKKKEELDRPQIIITTNKQEFRKTHPGVKIL